MTTLIKLEDVHKIYELEGGEVPALNGISLNINKADFVALVGQNQTMSTGTAAKEPDTLEDFSGGHACGTKNNILSDG